MHPSCGLPARSPQVIAKVLVSIAVALGAVGLAPVAGADPNPFSNLSWSCQSPPDLGPAVRGQIYQGIQDGLSDLQATQGDPIS